MTNPAQTARGTNFVKDVPVQGPTDEGMRQAACNHAQTLPSTPGCDSCKETIPMWARTGLSEQISLGGAPVVGFGALDDVWVKLNRDQQTWVMNSLSKLNDLIIKSTGTSCPTWGPSITAAGGCFQQWYNANALPLNPQAKLRTDGVFDEDSLCALLVTAALDPNNFPTGFPDPEGKFCQVKSEGMSKGMTIGLIAGGVAVVVGGSVYLATRKKRR